MKTQSQVNTITSDVRRDYLANLNAVVASEWQRAKVQRELI